MMKIGKISVFVWRHFCVPEGFTDVAARRKARWEKMACWSWSF